ncbi:MAG TPA: hypothetical protein VLL25_17340 [Acidimicrobiales bacterium]|nr:hypothetical protein [Acidimicrobiales bacterium]
MMAGHQQPLDGLDADVRITILGARFDTADTLELGETVTLTVKGHVVMTGREALEDEGVRGVVKIRADVIEMTS